MAVPLFATSLEPHHDELLARLNGVLAGGRYVLGPEVDGFECEFAEYIGVRHCIGVANGTDALTIALRALGVQAGDEVIVPSFTFYATAEAVVTAGATPVFCDIEPGTFCVTRETVERALTPRTRAVVPVHLFGNVAPVDDLRELGLPVLEDAAQAAGATVDGRRAGSLGDAATFSFFPSKNLPCLGDGGAIVTDDDEVADLARRLRFHGSRDKVTYTEVGYNSRLDELQAAVLRALLPELDGWNAARREAAARYADSGLGETLTLPAVPGGVEHVYHLYVARHEHADQLGKAAERELVQARGYYRTPVHRQPAMEPYARGVELPGTEEAAATNLALPMGPELSPDDTEAVVKVILEAATREGARA